MLPGGTGRGWLARGSVWQRVGVRVEQQANTGGAQLAQVALEGGVLGEGDVGERDRDHRQPQADRVVQQPEARCR